MKNYLIIILLFVMAIPFSHAQTGNKEQLNKQILKLSKQISASSSEDYDKLAVLNDDLADQINQYIQLTPDFLQKDFPAWSENGIYMTTSADKKLRIVFWNMQTGGTMREYQDMICWQTAKGAKSSMMNEGGSASYSVIDAFKKQDGGTFYIANGMVHGSNRDKENFIQAYAIDGMNLNDKAEVFKTPKKRLNYISLALDMATVTTDDDFIHFSKDKKTLYLPAANAKGEVKKGVFLVYKYDGNGFVFQQTGKVKP